MLVRRSFDSGLLHLVAVLGLCVEVVRDRLVTIWAVSILEFGWSLSISSSSRLIIEGLLLVLTLKFSSIWFVIGSSAQLSLAANFYG